MTADRVNPWGLSPREIQVIELYIELGTAKLVAKAMDISYKTVEMHLTNIHKQMKVLTTLQAALLFDRENNDLRIPIRHPKKQKKPVKAWPSKTNQVNSVFALAAA